MKVGQQDCNHAETQVLQQETILKSVLTRSGLDNLAIVNARIIPPTTSRFRRRKPSGRFRT